MRSLFLSRPVLNVDDILGWTIREGLPFSFDPELYHITLTAVRDPVDWTLCKPLHQRDMVISGGERRLDRLGSMTALIINDPLIKARIAELDWHYPTGDHRGEREPHISIFKSLFIDVNPACRPYEGDIVLGPERIEPFIENNNYKMDTPRSWLTARSCAVD